MADKKISLTAEEKELFLANVRFGQDGNDYTAVVINQLEKELYDNIDRILGLMHSKWSGKKKRHVFKAGYNPFEMTANLEAEGYITVQKDGFFSTPAELVKRLIELLEFGEIEAGVSILEPSAGTGAIAAGVCEALGIPTSRVSVVEQNDARRQALEEAGFNVIGVDFMDLPLDTLFDFIVMNPPFEGDLDAVHVAKAMKHLKPNGKLAAIMGWNIGLSNDVAYGRLRALANSVEENPKEAFKASGTTVQTFTFSFTRPADMTNADIDSIEPVAAPECEADPDENPIVYEKPEVLLGQIASEMKEMFVCISELAGLLNTELPVGADVETAFEALSKSLLSPAAAPTPPPNGKPVRIEIPLRDEHCKPKRRAKEKPMVPAGVQLTLF